MRSCRVLDNRAERRRGSWCPTCGSKGSLSSADARPRTNHLVMTSGMTAAADSERCISPKTLTYAPKFEPYSLVSAPVASQNGTGAVGAKHQCRPRKHRETCEG